MSRDHRKLKAFHLADELAIETYRVTTKFPKEEIYGLRSQIRRAATSVPLNIVEGSARRTKADYVHYLSMAFASLRELGYGIDLSNRLGFIESTTLVRFNELFEETSKVLSGLISSLERS